MFREMVIRNKPDLSAIAILDDGKLAEIYLERETENGLMGNIYLGQVENVLAGMQAAFVDIGLERNAFLYVEDALPKVVDDEGKLHADHNKVLSVNDVLKTGQKIMVQIFKEPVGSKGARVTTHPTIPGRYLVLLPTGSYIAISRRIEDEGERQRLRQMAEQILPKGMGVIIRTVAEGVEIEQLSQELKTLVKQWKRIQGKAAKSNAPSLIYHDLDLLSKVIRDTNDDIDRILVDNQDNFDQVSDIIQTVAPSLLPKLTLKASKDIFEEYSIFSQMEKALRRKIWLKSGSYIIVDQTEALTAIDVNTGKFTGSSNLSDTVCRVNLEAAAEVVRQIRLRNIGGIIIVDFIDMEGNEDKQKLLDFLQLEIKKDRTRVTVLGMTQLGLVEMTRKKIGQELRNVLERECPYCHGKGRVLSEEYVAKRLLEEIFVTAEASDSKGVFVETNPYVASCLQGIYARELSRLENKTGKKVTIKTSPELRMEENVVRADYGSLGAAPQPPVRMGQIVKVKIEERHPQEYFDGLAKIDGFEIDVIGGAEKIGAVVEAEIVSVWHDYAKAEII